MDVPQPDPQMVPFTTSDICLASFLIETGRPLSHIDGPPNLVVFHFAAVDSGDVDRYRMGAAIPAVLMATTQRRLFALVQRRRAETAKARAALARSSVDPAEARV